MIREIQDKDIDQLRKLHQAYFANEFRFDDFLNGLMFSFTVVDDNDNLVLSGGVRNILEVVAITDKEQSIFKKRTAYSQLIHSCGFVAERLGYEGLHAFVQGDRWIDALKSQGWTNCKGNAFFLKV